MLSLRGKETLQPLRARGAHNVSKGRIPLHTWIVWIGSGVWIVLFLLILWLD